MANERLEETKIFGLTMNFEKVTLYAMYSLAVLVPLIVGKPQILVGTFINFLIVYSTLTYGIKKSIPILILPSITATSKGVLFGSATYFLLYIMPFIMISNYLLSFFASKKKIALKVFAVFVKGIFLYVAYLIMNKTVGLPKVLMSSIPMQFLTAALGFTFAFTLHRFAKEE